MTTNTQYKAISDLLISRGYSALAEVKPVVPRGTITHIDRIETWHKHPGLQVLLIVWKDQGVKAFWDFGLGHTGKTLDDLEAVL